MTDSEDGRAWTPRILVVEDSDADADLSTAALAGVGPAGPDIVRARGFTEAVAILREQQLDLAVLDLTLPGAARSGTAPQTVAADEDVPVILIVGAGEGRVIAEAVRLGTGGAYLDVQPFSALGAMAAAILGHRRPGTRRPWVAALVEAMPDAIIVVDADGYARFVNRAAERLFGYPREYLVGDQFGFSVSESPADIDIATDQGLRTAELRVTDISWMGERASLAIIRDVTEQRSFPERLHDARLEAFGQMAAGITHDFNNLIGVILGCAEELIARMPPDEQPPLLDIMHAADAASRLTSQLLTFIKKTPQTAVPVDLNRLIQANMTMVEHLAGPKVAVTMNPGTGLPLVYADPAQIEQVLLNLVANARDAMPAGGSIDISTAVLADATASPPGQPSAAERLAPHTRYAVMLVHDTGQGIPPEAQRKIFEPFFTTKPRERGTGLGLAVAQGIVTQARGLITVDSAEGHGSTFAIYLPEHDPSPEAAGPVPRIAIAGPVPQAANPDPAPVPRTARQAGNGGEAILLVDDERLMREVTARMLERAGYRVSAADSGPSACELARGAPPFDLLITDAVMPGMSGYELIEALRERQPALRSLVISGYPGGDDQELDRQPDARLGKPFTRAALLAAVRKLLAG